MARLAFMIAVLAASAALAAPDNPPPLEAYGRLPAIEMMALSPLGDRYAVVGMDGAERKLVVRATSGALIHDVKIHDLKVRGLDWVDDDHLTVSSTITLTWRLGLDEREEDLFVLALNPTRHLLSVVFANQRDLYPAVFGVYGLAAAGGHAYGYFGGIRQVDVNQKGTAFTNLYRIDLDTGERVAMARGDGLLPHWFVDPRTGAVAATVVNGSGNGDWRILVGDKTVAQGAALFGRPFVLGYGRDGRTLLITRESDGDDQLSEVSLDGSATEDLDGDGLPVDPIMDRATARWLGEEKDGDLQVVHLFDTALQARWDKAAKACGADAKLISHDDAFDHVIVHAEGAGDAGSYCLVDTASGATHELGKDYPGLPASGVGEVRMVDFKAADGLALHGVLTLPAGRPARDLPLIVIPHGGPQARDYPRFDWWAQAFASRGYAVFQPNFRGSSGYGFTFTKAGFGQWGRKMQTDISDGVAALAAQGLVNPKRACIVGGSYGGYAALAGVTIQQGLYRCAVSWGGVTEPAAMIHYDSPLGGPAKTDANRYWRRFLGVEGNKRINLDDISPLHLAGRADAPILLMYGTDDTVVAPTQSQWMIEALRKAGRPVETLVLKGEDHWLSKSATRSAMLNKAVAFALKYDPPD